MWSIFDTNLNKIKQKNTKQKSSLKNLQLSFFPIYKEFFSNDFLRSSIYYEKYFANKLERFPN